MHRQPQHDDHEGGEADAGPDAFLDLREGTCDKTSFRGFVGCQFCRL